MIALWHEGDFPEDQSLRILQQIAFNATDQSLSLQYAESLIELSRQEENLKYLFDGFSLLGQAHAMMGEWEQALRAYNEAVELADQRDNQDELGQVYGLMASVYSENGKADLSVEYYKRAISILTLQHSTASDTISLAATYMNLGHAYYQMDILDSALYYQEMAGTLFAEAKYELGSLYCLGNIGLIYAKKGQNDHAESNMREAISQLEVYEDYLGIADFENQLADIYRQRGDYALAMANAEKSYQRSKEKDLKLLTRDACYRLYEINIDMRRFARAVDYLNEYYAYRDSITNAENIQRIADMRTAFEVGQKQAEVDLLEVETRNQQIAGIAMASVLLLVMILAFVLHRNNIHKKKVNRILENQKKQLEDLNHTKDRFFSIISHDLRGPVNAFHGVSRMIKFFVKNKQMDQLDMLAEEIDKSVDRLSSLLDNLLNWAVQQQGHVPYIPEKLDIHEIADDLVHIFTTMADSKDIHLTSEVPKGIVLWGDRNTINTIIRNLINNSLKFTPENGSVTIGAEVVGDNGVIKVSDTGVGIPTDKLEALFRLHAKKSTWGTKGEKGLGLGLQLVNEFVEMNNGKIEVESEVDAGTTFKVWLPLFTEQLTPEVATV